MTLEVKYKNRCDYSYISGDVLEIRDLSKKGLLRFRLSISFECKKWMFFA